MLRKIIGSGLGTCVIRVGLLQATATLAADRPFSIKVQGKYFVANGVIDSRTPGRVAKAIGDRPDIRILVLNNVPGSADDAANLQASLLIRKAGLTTIVPAKGLISSGGTDMFLAGKQRIIEKGACVGVLSWAAGNKQGADFPDSSSAHDGYLDYYRAVGIPSDFYWFTLDVADADEMHWMSINEIKQFRMVTNRPKHGAESENSRYARCDRRG